MIHREQKSVSLGKLASRGRKLGVVPRENSRTSCTKAPTPSENGGNRRRNARPFQAKVGTRRNNPAACATFVQHQFRNPGRRSKNALRRGKNSWPRRENSVAPLKNSSPPVENAATCWRQVPSQQPNCGPGRSKCRCLGVKGAGLGARLPCRVLSILRTPNGRRRPSHHHSGQSAHHPPVAPGSLWRDPLRFRLWRAQIEPRTDPLALPTCSWRTVSNEGC